jgi:hypothetical protein
MAVFSCNPAGAASIEYDATARIKSAHDVTRVSEFNRNFQAEFMGLAPESVFWSVMPTACRLRRARLAAPGLMIGTSLGGMNG